MNLFFSFIVLTMALFSSQAHAVALQGLYTAACQRQIGTILQIDSQAVSLLTIEGKLLKIPKYEIIYMAEYPMDRIPATGNVYLGDIPTFVVFGRKGRSVVELTRGWPIEFSEEKIAMLAPDGSEYLIDKRRIWKVDQVPSGEVKFASGVIAGNLEFVHPYTFRECANQTKAAKIYPQQILNDPVLIKKELDRLQKGFALISRYEREQSFYPVPEVYTNKTSLGLWHNFSSRYGNSKKRSNNFTPLLIDEVSTDIFDFQRQIQTGSGWLNRGVHEEPQMQMYYSFKASYFHFSAMIDPSTLLVGSNNYRWQREDFDRVDDKLHQLSDIEFGFDFGQFAILIPLGTSVPWGIFDGQNLSVGSYGLAKFGLAFRKPLWQFSLVGGSGESNIEDGQRGKAGLSMARLDFQYEWTPKLKINTVLLNREVSMKPDLATYTYAGKSTTLSAQAEYELSHRFTVASYLSLESKSHRLAIASETALIKNSAVAVTYPKIGAAIHLSF